MKDLLKQQHITVLITYYYNGGHIGNLSGRAKVGPLPEIYSGRCRAEVGPRPEIYSGSCRAEVGPRPEFILGRGRAEAGPQPGVA